MHGRLFEYRVSNIEKTTLLNSVLTVKGDIYDVVKEVLSIETNGHADKAFEVKISDYKDLAPQDYMNLFRRYGYYVERQIQRTKTLGTVEVLKIVFPLTRHTYSIKEVLFSNYTIVIEDKTGQEAQKQLIKH